MEVGHSRLLKFFTKGRYKDEMAEVPIIQIQKDYESPPNVEAEVPGSHKIRELDNKNNSEESSSEIQVTGAEFTLSPVITVTEKDTTLITKGGVKSQKVTVTEDIAEEENGGYRISREVERLTQTDRELSGGTVVSSERREKRVKEENMEGEEKSHDEKKSKIPIMRLRQAVEKVKLERQAQKAREKPRRSSIPKLKDAKKAIKRDTSLNFVPKLEDEFEKIYEEIVENKQKEIDEKILAVPIEDTEKVESRFEEIIQSYDEDEQEKPPVSRVSKIPALRRRDDDRPSRIGALIDRARDKNSVTESKLKDGGFKVTASTIRTKRFSRGNSKDLSSEEHKVEVTETIDIKESVVNEVFVQESVKKAPVKPERSIRRTSKRISRDDKKVDSVETIENTEDGRSKNVVKETIVKESVKEGIPVRTKKIMRVISREMRRDGSNIDSNEKFGDINNNGEEGKVIVEEFEDGGSRTITTKTSVTENVQVTPVKTERIARGMSREIIKDNQNINLIEKIADLANSSNTETVTVEEFDDGGNRTVTTTTTITESIKVGAPLIAEKNVRNISREISSETQNVAEKVIKDDNKKTPVKPERFTRGISKEIGNIKQRENKETVTLEEVKDDSSEKVINKTITKENVKVGTPVFTKVTQSFSKGRIQNVEMSRTIEWKPADEVRTKNYSRSVSEKVTKKELKDTGNWKLEAPNAIGEVTEISEPKVDTIIKSEATSNQDKLPIKDPDLERKIKDTVKDIASKVIIKKVTEYQSEEQVIDVERNTFSLSKSVNLTVNRDFKEPKNNDKQGVKESRDDEINIKQVGKEYSTEINKESFQTDTISEKKDTKYEYSPTQEKDSDVDEVTVLKGNVSRLKNKIAKENVNVPKKETDKELPKKKSVLSKIAMFERLEPSEPYPVIPARKIKCKYIPKEINSEPYIVDELLKDQPTLDSLLDRNKVEIGINYDEVAYINEPVIVKEYWKTEEGIGENVSTINRVITKETMTFENLEDNAKILPGTIDFTLNERQTEYVQTLPANIEFKRNEKLLEVAKPLPGKINFIGLNQSIVDTVQSDNNQIEEPSILPGKIDYEAEIGRIKPGKLNLNIWKNQVEVNQTLVDKFDVIRGESIEEIKTLPGKVDFKTYDSQVPVSKALPGTFDLKEEDLKKNIDFEVKEIQFEVATTLPGKIDLKANDSQNQIGMTLPAEVDFKNLENKIEVGKAQLNDFKTEEIHTEIVIPLPGRIDFEVKTDQDFNSVENQIEVPKILPDKKDYLKPNEVGPNKAPPGKINLNLWKNQVEVNKTLVGKTVKRKSKEVETAKTFPGRVDIKTYDKKIEVSKTMQGKVQSNTSENKVEICKTLPGKIYLNNTRSQVEEIRTLPATIDFSPSHAEIVETLPDKVEFSTALNTQLEPITTFPGKVEIETYESQAQISETLQSNVDYSTAESLTEDITTQPAKIDLETGEKKTVKVTLCKTIPGKLDLKAWENQVEENKTLVDKIDAVRSENLEEIVKTLPGKNDISTYVSQVENPKTLPGIIDINMYDTKVQIKEIPKENIDLETNNNEAEVATILPGKVDIESFENKPKLNNFHMALNTLENKGQNNEAVQLNNDLKMKDNKVEYPTELDPAESLSDPELVDEDPKIEVKLNKDSIIGKIKRKMYFITNNVQNATNEPIKTEVSVVSDYKENDYERRVEELQTKTYSIENIDKNTVNQTKSIDKAVITINTEKKDNIQESYTRNVTAKEYELDCNSNTVQNITSEINTDTSENIETNDKEFNFTSFKVENEMSRSAYEYDFKNSKEDLKRAKSLAELDLGDLIHGNVKRMVGRMKSVDFERRESTKTEKISIKEMPKKLSVLEKIALFEGKASPLRSESTPLRTKVTKKDVTQFVSEEEYLRKIEDFTNAKTKFGRLEDMLYLPLANGVEMPVIALGTAMVDNRLLPYLIGAAIDLGYRAIDTAYIYGNEKEIGQAIKAKIDDGTVKREDLFIISKLWSTFHRTDLVEEACKSSLKNLGLDYFDLFMIHNPMSFKEGPDPIPKIATVLQYSQYDYMDAWFGMEGLVSKGLARSIGVSNFNSQQIQRILDKGKMKPVVNQVECHPYLSQQKLDAFCSERNISLSCFGVLGSKGTPAEYKNSTTPAIDDALVKVMASGLNVSPAQLLIRYQIECGHSVVVKCSSATRLWDNLQALTFTLDQPHVDALHALNRNKRTFTFAGMGDTHKNYPFRGAF